MTENTTLSSLIKKTQLSAKVSRLIAEENIAIVYSTEVNTASFDSVARQLTYPYSLVLDNEDIHDLMMHHEIGHAKYSKLEQKWKEAVANRTSMYVNIIEDIRIEKMVKKDYPGCVKNFNEGYKKLLEMEFFGPIDELAMTRFANRLNVYSKIGPITGSFFKFNEKETDFIKLCNANTSEEGTYILAKLLVDFDKVDRNRIKELREEFGNGDVDLDEDFDDENSLTHEEEEIEGLMDADSLKAFDDKMKAASLKDCTVVSFESIPNKPNNYYSANNIYKKLLNEYDAEYINHVNVTSLTMRNSLSKQIDFMARQFELKKQAHREKYATMSDTGKININRIYGYKYTDDIFLSKFKVGDSKNHGIVLLLDVSGSIQEFYQDMIQQTILVTEFCRKTNIPFKVFLFGASLNHRYQEHMEYGHVYDSNTFVGREIMRENLIEVLDSDMTISQYKTMVGSLITKIFFTFQATPTTEAMLKIEPIATEFFNKHNIQVRKIIVVTDGDPGDGIREMTRSHKSVMINDPLTKQNIFSPKTYPYLPIDIAGKIFKTRHNIDLITIAITKSSKIDHFISSFGITDTAENYKKQFSRDNYYHENSPMNHPVFFVKSVNSDLEIEDIKIDNTKSLSGIANDFKKGLTSIKKNHNFLNILTKYLSEA